MTNPKNNMVAAKVAGLSLAVACASLAPAAVQAGDWAWISGDVRLADGTPVCAMVLANGTYMFSCDGFGSYGLTVPLDDNGQITLFSFADGFAPFSVTTDPSAFPYAVRMQPGYAASPIVGSWETPPGDDGTTGLASFHSDGTYANMEPHSQDCDGVWGGLEAGTYSYDETNHLLTATSVAFDRNGNCGLTLFGQLGTYFTVEIEGETAQICDSVSCADLTRLP